MFWPIVALIVAVVIVAIVLVHAFRPHYHPPSHETATTTPIKPNPPIPPGLAVTAVTPNSGSLIGGNTVIIRGTGFDPGATVMFGNQPGTNVTFVSSTELTAVAPAGTGTVDVQASVGALTSAVSAADKYTYLGPTITGLNPSSVSSQVAGTITITGTGFSKKSTITFYLTSGNNAGAFQTVPSTFVSATKMTADVPLESVFNGGGSTPWSGTTQLTVTTNGQTSAKTPASQLIYWAPVTANAAQIPKVLFTLVNSYRSQKGLPPLSNSNSLNSVAGQATNEGIDGATPDVTLIMANSTPVITVSNEVDAFITGPNAGDAQHIFDNGIIGNAITLAALNNPAMTSFGSFFVDDPNTGLDYTGTIIFAQNVNP